MPAFIPRERNVIQEILLDHFLNFGNEYEEKYSKDYDEYRIIRIHETVNNFIECGDYSKEIAGIICTTNKECKYEYFRPFFCKQWYLYPSCHQKKLLLFVLALHNP